MASSSYISGEITIYTTLLLLGSALNILACVNIGFIMEKDKCCFYTDEFGWKTNESGIMAESPLFLWTGMLLSCLGLGVGILGCYRKWSKVYVKGVVAVALSWTTYRFFICISIHRWNTDQKKGVIDLYRTDYTTVRLVISVLLEGLLFALYYWRVDNWNRHVEYENLQLMQRDDGEEIAVEIPRSSFQDKPEEHHDGLKESDH
uniref:Uncharacterized protein n=1 Tax=Entomoneis paludosa TaxID=265537 RepID=A0A7S2VAA8_9STRA|mmetsp:Transcript_13346/g.27669  ORF Transcript_13346/g.27669 Transcript_13346/m.27669 type:complete len:204 (+) Transcript_13346:1-612(+)